MQNENVAKVSQRWLNKTDGISSAALMCTETLTCIWEINNS